MNLNISRIKENRNSYKSIESVVLELYNEYENYLSYDLIKTENLKGKLVFKNLNHKGMLHKHLVFEHFYIVLLLTLSICVYQMIIGSYLMSVLLFVGGGLLMYKLLKESDVPYKLVFDGLNVYELNYIGKRIVEFSPSIIENSNSSEYEKDFIFMSNKSKGNMKSLIIMKGVSFEVRDLFAKYFRN